jgi:geranylgeranyl diphosphate synthase type II
LAIEVCEGQQYDMSFETQNSVEISAYLKMIELKTSVLIAGGLKMGALIGGASNEDANELYEFGRNIGIAFQLQDDILDTFGDPEKFGKKVGGDIAQNKKTFLLLSSIKQAKGQDKADLMAALSENTESEQKIKTVTSIYRKLNVQEQATELMEDYLQKAFVHLDRVKVENTRKILLKNLANQLMMREI